MTTHALSHREESSDLRWMVIGIIAGALSLIVCHQTIAMLLYSMGITAARSAARPVERA